MTMSAMAVRCAWLLGVLVSAGSTAETPQLKEHSARLKAMAEALGLTGGSDEPPIPEKVVRPKYPRQALESCTEGTVQVLLGIDVRGRVAAAEVLEPVSGLNDAAIACVKGWRFKLARKGGVAVGTVAVLPVVFRISDRDRQRFCAKQRQEPPSQQQPSPGAL